MQCRFAVNFGALSSISMDKSLILGEGGYDPTCFLGAYLFKNVHLKFVRKIVFFALLGFPLVLIARKKIFLYYEKKKSGNLFFWGGGVWLI